MQLKPQDFLISLKIAVLQMRREKCSYQQLAESCGLSTSDAHAAVKRAGFSGFLTHQPAGWSNPNNVIVIGNYAASRGALIEFGIHGLKFVWPAKEGPVRLGLPTGLAVAADELDMVRGGASLVWPTDDGTVTGISLEPWHPALPKACLHDSELHLLAAILDVIRTGGARAAEQARKALERRLSASIIHRVAS